MFIVYVDILSSQHASGVSVIWQNDMEWVNCYFACVAEKIGSQSKDLLQADEKRE